MASNRLTEETILEGDYPFYVCVACRADFHFYDRDEMEQHPTFCPRCGRRVGQIKERKN